MYLLMGEKKHLDTEWLVEQYHEKGRTQADIAEECGITQSTLSGHMKRHGILTRSRSEAASEAQEPDEPYTNPGWLRQQYHGEQKTLQEIGDECDVSHQTIRHWMDKHDIERRGQVTAQRPTGPYTDPEWLREQYHGGGKSIEELADAAGTNVATIHKWMVRFDIERRSFDYERRTGPVSYESVYGEFGKIPGGYMQLRASVTSDSESERLGVYVHQLLAIAEGADPAKVFSGGDYHVHHKDGLRWHNQPENIELLTVGEHREIHTDE